jgi:hypothetical protein
MRRRDLVIGDPYYAAWQQYRRVWWRSLLLVAVFFYGGGILTMLIVDKFFPSGPGWLAPLGIVASVAAGIVASQAPGRWRCPRCDNRFLRTTWGPDGLATRCHRCGLPKWAPKDVG